MTESRTLLLEGTFPPNSDLWSLSTVPSSQMGKAASIVLRGVHCNGVVHEVQIVTFERSVAIQVRLDFLRKFIISRVNSAVTIQVVSLERIQWSAMEANALTTTAAATTGSGTGKPPLTIGRQIRCKELVSGWIGADLRSCKLSRAVRVRSMRNEWICSICVFSTFIICRE